MEVYWVTSLVFSVSAVVFAMLGKRIVRDYRDRLALRRHLKGQPIRSLWDGPIQGLAMFATTDTVYRLFQIALVLVLLGTHRRSRYIRRRHSPRSDRQFRSVCYTSLVSLDRLPRPWWGPFSGGWRLG